MSTTETEAPEVSGNIKILMKSDGTLYYSAEGVQVTVAKYDRKTGNVEFDSKDMSTKFYNAVVTKVGTVSDGREESGNKIKAFTVKGQTQTVDKNAPKRPKFGPLGDAAEEVVQWYLDHAPAEAVVRYGIYTDEKGRVIRKDVARRVISTVDMRDTHDDSSLEWMPDGNKSKSKAPVAQQAEFQRLKSQVIARRATQLTFTPNEVVGGFDVEDATDGEDSE